MTAMPVRQPQHLRSLQPLQPLQLRWRWRLCCHAVVPNARVTDGREAAAMVMLQLLMMTTVVQPRTGEAVTGGQWGPGGWCALMQQAMQQLLAADHRMRQ